MNKDLHVAIIMDGNGRWAQRRGLPRTAGHTEGARAVRATVEEAAAREISILTLYAFSADNWQRPALEVATLMRLFRRYLMSETQRCIDNGIRLNVIGRRDRVSNALVRTIEESERLTAHCTGMHLRIAVDYSARQSIVSAGQLVAEGTTTPDEFRQLLDRVNHSSTPATDVDLLIRTGGEQRLSDFMLFECAYAELVFLDCYWPDFGKQDLANALDEFQRRHRRFGQISSAQEQ